MAEIEDYRKAEEPFEPLEIPRKELALAGVSRYRVYRNPDSYTIVEAENALEALKASGMKEAYRIMRDALYFMNVVKTDIFATTPPADAQATVATEEAPAPVVQEAAAAPEKPPVAEEALSDSDVSRLLQG